MNGYFCVRNLERWANANKQLLNWLEHMDSRQQAAARKKFANSYVTSFWFRMWNCGWKHAFKPVQSVGYEFVNERYVQPVRFMWWEYDAIEKLDRYLKHAASFSDVDDVEMYLTFDQMEIFSRVERARYENSHYPKKNHDA